MRLDHEEIQRIARERERSLTSVLSAAGVSRTAYYSLVRRDSILPKTIRDLARELAVEPERLLRTVPTEVTYQRRLERTRALCERHPDADFQNVWHTLTLLDLPPIERLRRSLRRGRA